MNNEHTKLVYNNKKRQVKKKLYVTIFNFMSQVFISFSFNIIFFYFLKLLQNKKNIKKRKVFTATWGAQYYIYVDIFT